MPPDSERGRPGRSGPKVSTAIKTGSTIPSAVDPPASPMSPAVYQARQTKHKVRPTRAQTERLRAALYEIVDESKPTGLRFVYYRAVARGLVEKSDGGYNKVQYALMQMREQGVVPWGWIVDSSRWVQRPRTYDSAADAAAELAQGYVRNIWSNADATVEVWVESKSAAGVIAPVTFRWCVDLFPITGQTSASFAYEAAWAHLSSARPLHILYLGDHDPAGHEIETNLVQKLHRFGRTDLEFTRLACTPEQVSQYDLIGTAPKKNSYRDAITGERVPWSGLAYEVEGVDAPILRTIVEDAIVSYLDTHRLYMHRVVQEQERQGLLAMANGWSA